MISALLPQVSADIIAHAKMSAWGCVQNRHRTHCFRRNLARALNRVQYQKDISAADFDRTLSRLLRAINYRRPSARPRHHTQAEGATEDFKNFPAHLEEIGREKGVDPAGIEI
jgi:hypothetical protein